MAKDITLKPNFNSDKTEFDEFIEDIEINFKTQKDTFIGSFNSWEILMNLNSSNVEIPETIKLNLGTNGNYRKTPTFTLTPVIDEETEESTQIKGYDKSIVFDQPVEWTFPLPITAGNLTKAICDKLGVAVKSIDFINSDFVIYRQIADEKRTYRELIGMISAIAAGNAFINSDDQLEIRSFLDTDLEIEEYFSSEKFVEVGPITGVNLAREPIKDYVTLNDGTMAAKYGICVVKIINNLIVDDNRELAIQKIYDELKGLAFYCKKIETHEAYNVEPFSFVNLNGVKVLVDSICIKYPSLIDSYISSNQLNKVESNLNIDRGIKKRLANAEAKVDEVEGKITLLSEEINDTSEKMSSFELDMNEIKTKVEDIEDLTVWTNGTIGYKTSDTDVVVEKAMAGEVIEMTIKSGNPEFEKYKNGTFFYGDSILYIKSILDKSNYSYGSLWSDGSYHSSEYPNDACIILEVTKKGRYSIFKNKDSVFKVATFKEFPNNNDKPNRFVRNDVGNRIEIDVIDDDKYMVIHFWNSELSEASLENTYNSIEIDSYRSEIDLKIKEPLRYLTDENVYDEFIYKGNLEKNENDEEEQHKAKVIRRVGITENDELYKLPEEKIEYINLDEDIILGEGTNYFSLDYEQYGYATIRYVPRNSFTAKFATTYELRSSITQLSNQVDIKVKEKVGKDEIIARLNMAILGINDTDVPEDVEKSIIQIISNLIEIDSDFLKLKPHGEITILANLNENYKYTYLDVCLALEHIEKTITLPERLVELYDTSNDGNLNVTDVVKMINIINGKDEATKSISAQVTIDPNDAEKIINIKVNDDLQTIISLFQIYTYMIKCSNLLVGEGYSTDMNEATYGIQLNGKNKEIKIVDKNNSVATTIDSGKVDAYNVYSSAGGGKGHCMHGIDLSHTYRCHWTGTQLQFFVDSTNIGSLSDKRLKTNISDIDENLLQAINEVELKQFNLANRKDKIGYGIIAQDLIEIFNKYNVDLTNKYIVTKELYRTEDDTLYYKVDYEQLLLLKTKCLEQKIEKIENHLEKIEKLLGQEE